MDLANEFYRFLSDLAMSETNSELTPEKKIEQDKKLKKTINKWLEDNVCHIIEYPSFHDKNVLSDWLKENINGNYLQYSDYVRFELEEDALLFKLTWS